MAVNLVMLLFYQRYLGVDFPYADEWGYVARLGQIPQMGFRSYLFGHYQNYYIPVFLGIWYLSYALSHLDLMLLRYCGAVVSTLVALLLCAMLYRRSGRSTGPTIAAILCAPFVICSYNHAAAYSQAIESVAEPLLFGLVLLTAWAAETGQQPGRTLTGAILCLLGSLAATGIYAPPLALLPAIAAARFLLRPRVDWTILTLGGLGLALAVLYLWAGDSAGTGFRALGSGGLSRIPSLWLGLNGGALAYVGRPSVENFTLALGACLLFLQLVAVVQVLRLPVERRQAFLIPMVLSTYNFLVFLEILVARVGVPGAEFTPRYSTHMLGGVVSVLFWVVTLGETRPWDRWLASGAIAIVLCGLLIGEAEGVVRLQSNHVSMARARSTLVSLRGNPDAPQQTAMFATSTMAPLIYPGRTFLQNQALALYKDRKSKQDAASSR